MDLCRVCACSSVCCLSHPWINLNKPNTFHMIYEIYMYIYALTFVEKTEHPRRLYAGNSTLLSVSRLNHGIETLA